MPGSRAAERMRIPLTECLLWLKDKQIEVYDGRSGASIADLYATMLKDWDISPVGEQDRCGELCRALCEKMAGEFNLSENDQEHEFNLSENDQEQKKVVLSFEEYNVKKMAMSLLGEYPASKKAQAKETGVEAMSPETSISSTCADSTSSALGEPESSSDSTLPEVLPIGKRNCHEVTVAVHNSGRDKRRIRCFLCRKARHTSANCPNFPWTS